MHQQLPKEIDPLRLAKNGLKLTGQLPIADMPRLLQSLHNDGDLVKVNISFDVDEINTPFMRGHFISTVSMICERCMKAMSVCLNVNCLLAIVTNEHEVDGLADQYEPWLLKNSGNVVLASVIEDELILALPLVPRHDKECLPDSAWTSPDKRMDKTEKKESPFTILSTLKTNKKLNL